MQPWTAVKPALASIGYAILMKPNKTEIAVHGFLIPALVIWLCACVRWYGCAHAYGLLVSFNIWGPGDESKNSKEINVTQIFAMIERVDDGADVKVLVLRQS